MDEQGDYHIKVLDMAPLIKVTLPTVSSFFSTCGCFLRDGRFPSGDLPSLSLDCGWPPGANGSAPCEWRRLQDFRVENPSGARRGGQIDPRPTSARFGRPFAPVGPHAFMHFAPSLALFWRCHPRVQDGGSLCMKSGLLRFNPRGCSS
jgi:hypothetical protein